MKKSNNYLKKILSCGCLEHLDWVLQPSILELFKVEKKASKLS